MTWNDADKGWLPWLDHLERVPGKPFETSSYAAKFTVFIALLKHANIVINRKMLSQIAIYDRDTFDKIVDLANMTAKC